jgi:hypothetical protein
MSTIFRFQIALSRLTSPADIRNLPRFEPFALKVGPQRGTGFESARASHQGDPNAVTAQIVADVSKQVRIHINGAVQHDDADMLRAAREIALCDRH